VCVRARVSCCRVLTGRVDFRGAEQPRCKFSYTGIPVHSHSEALQDLRSAPPSDVKRFLLATAHVLSVLYCRRIAVAALSLAGTRLLSCERLLLCAPSLPPTNTPPADSTASDADSDASAANAAADEASVRDNATYASTCGYFVLRVLRMCGWKGLGLSLNEAARVFKASATRLPDGRVEYAAGSGPGRSPATHMLQLAEPAMRRALRHVYSTSSVTVTNADCEPSFATPLSTGVEYPPLISLVFRCIETDVAKAASREHAGVQWTVADLGEAFLLR
jgi:hypothetical protein